MWGPHPHSTHCVETQGSYRSNPIRNRHFKSRAVVADGACCSLSSRITKKSLRQNLLKIPHFAPDASAVILSEKKNSWPRLVVVSHDVPRRSGEILEATLRSFPLAVALHLGDFYGEGTGGCRAGASKDAREDVALVACRNVHVLSRVCPTYHRRCYEKF